MISAVVICVAVLAVAGVLSLAMARGGAASEASSRPALERRLEPAPARWTDPETAPEDTTPWRDPEPESEAAA